jgi:hypothetical protein
MSDITPPSTTTQEVTHGTPVTGTTKVTPIIAPPSDTPSPPPPQTQESTGRKAFITTLVSILLSPLSVALGFYLNHVLQKPQLHVQELGQIYYLESHLLPRNVLSGIQALPLLSAQLRDVITRTELAKGDVTCVDWLDDKPWRDKCFDTVLTAARGIDSAILATSFTRPPKGLETTLPTAAEILSFRSALKPLVEWLATSSADKKQVRTGGYCVLAHVVNTGDIDGVVLNAALLRFEKGSVTINAEKYTVVKAHGYEQIEFCAESALDGEKASLDAWGVAVKSRDETPFEVVLKTGDAASLGIKAHLWK